LLATGELSQHVIVDSSPVPINHPGLLVDESLKHFPIKNFSRLRAMRPQTIQPVEITVPEKSFAVLLFEEGDEQELPLLRLEVRLKKNDPNGKEGPVNMIWNSTLRVFHLKVVGIDEALGMEKERYMEAREIEIEDRRKDQHAVEVADTQNLTKEEREQRKERKKQEYLQRLREEQREMGMTAWKELDEERNKATYVRNRLKTLAKLSEVGTLVVDGNVGMDVDIAHLGWFGILSPRSTMIKAYAPNTGVRVTCHPSLALPKKWGSYDKPKDTSVKGKSADEGAKDKDKRSTRARANEDVSFEAGSDDDEDDLGADDFDDDFDDEFDEDLDFGDDEGDEDEDFGAGDMYDSPYSDDVEERGGSSFRYVRGSRNPFQSFDVEEDADGKPKDPWGKYSGENVGWQYDEDVRFSKNPNIKEGWNLIPKTEEEKEEEQKSGYRNKKRYGS
jgi:hypothetical protein